MSNSHEFRWTHYLDLADELGPRPDAQEAHLRAAIGRAYYAAFHVAMGLLEQEGFQPTGRGDDHRKVWRRYRVGPRTGRERKGIAQRGYDLLYDREKADYRVPFGGARLEDAARLALKNARHIVEWVERVQARQGGGSPRDSR